MNTVQYKMSVSSKVGCTIEDLLCSCMRHATPASSTVSQIERVFTAASHKKVWDHFTKAQRKNIEMWKKQSSVCNYTHTHISSVPTSVT